MRRWNELDDSERENYRTRPMSHLESAIHSARLGSLPSRLRILFVAGREGGASWLAEALSADNAVVVAMEEVVGAEAALGRLRDDVFDAIAIEHAPGVLDALDLTEGARGLGVDQPIIVLGEEEPGDFATLVYEIGGDAYLCPQSTSTRTLLWTLARACERYELVRENRRLAQCEKSRLRQEQEDTQRLLAEQRSLIRPTARAPQGLQEHYSQLLRTHVIMGCGNLKQEIDALAQMLFGAGVSAESVLCLHLDTLEELIRGLGNRSARHILVRADLLIVDLLSRLMTLAQEQR